jgi:hypothetical protein
MTDAITIFKQAPLFTDEVPYVLVQFPPQRITLAAGLVAELNAPFSALIVDKDEVTAILPHEVLEDFQTRLQGARMSQPYRLITLDLQLPPDLVGFMAYVTKLLADAKISIIPIGAFGRDHLLVPEADFERAWQTLKEAQGS